MVTVGEMVNALGAERAPAVTREIDYDDFRNCRLTYDELVAVYIGLLSNLRDLGIWDAEVLEFELRRDHEDSDMLWWECDQKHSAAGSSVFSETFDGPEAEYVGQRVRVIVLPAKEE